VAERPAAARRRRRPAGRPGAVGGRGSRARGIAKAGLNGIGIPEEYGGQGGDLLDQTIVGEELSRTR